MAIEKSEVVAKKFYMSRVVMDTAPLYDVDGNAIGITGSIDATGGYRNVSTGEVSQSDYRHQSWSMQSLCEAVLALGNDPQEVIGLFARLFEAREIAESVVADNIAAV